MSSTYLSHRIEKHPKSLYSYLLDKIIHHMYKLEEVNSEDDSKN